MPRTYPQAFRPLAVTLGCVLVVAAILKLVSTTPPPRSPLTELLPSWSLNLIPALELVVAAWLFSGVYRIGAWVVAESLLFAFAIQGLLLTLSRQPSCGCFGTVTVPPAYVLVFDVAMFATLIRCRPDWAGWPENTPLLRTATVALVSLAIVLIAAKVWYGTIHVAVASALGKPLAVSSANLDLGRTDPGAQTENSLTLVNLSEDTVHVLAFESSCQCAEVLGLPVVIEAGASVSLPVTVTVSQRPGEFQRVGRFRTSAGDLDFKIVAFVKGSQPGPAPSRTPPGG